MIQDTISISAQTLLRPVSAVLVLFVLILAPWIYAKVTLQGPRGCRKLGIKPDTELADQYDQDYTSPPSKSSIPLNEKIGYVKALHIFPIKSCGAVESSKIQITRTGPRYDRQFAFAQWHTYSVGKEKFTGWNKITQREFPKMALVEPEVWVPDSSAPKDSSHEPHINNGGCLVISFPRQTSFSVDGLVNTLASLACKIMALSWSATARHSFRLPLEPSSKRIKELKCPIGKVQVWADNANGVDMRGLVPAKILNELKSFLGVQNEFAIFRTDPDNYREVFRNAPRVNELGYQATTGFADSYPLHLLNLASVHNVAAYLPPQFGLLDARRFRSNVLVTGPPAHSEDNWAVATIGPSGYKFYLTDHTTRCQLPNVDPAKGENAPYKLPWHAEPLKTLLGKDRSRNPAFMEPLKAMRDPARANRCIDKGAEDKACLGMQMVPRIPVTDTDEEEEEVWIHIGDDVVVLETGEHIFRAK